METSLWSSLVSVLVFRGQRDQMPHKGLITTPNPKNCWGPYASLQGSENPGLAGVGRDLWICSSYKNLGLKPALKHFKYFLYTTETVDKESL